MGVLAAGALYANSVRYSCGCRPRIEELRIAIAARGVECSPPEHWPSRGDQ